MCGTFRRISQLWDDARTLNLEKCFLYLLSTISQFFDFVRCILFDFILYCVTAHTLYMIGAKLSDQRNSRNAGRFKPTNPRLASHGFPAGSQGRVPFDQNSRKFRFKIEWNRNFPEIHFENFGSPLEVVLFGNLEIPEISCSIWNFYPV